MRLYELLLEARSESLFSKYQAKILAQRDRGLNNLDTTSGLEFVQRLESEFGRYVEWVLVRWLNSDFLSEDIPRVRAAIDQFEQKKRGLEKKDINQYRSLSELEDAVGLLDDVKSNRQVKQEIKSDGLRKIFENDSYMIAELLTEEAAKFYGKGTKWCTAAEKNNMFSRYHADGPLYIVVDKADNRKYQLHFESRQFMDELDKPVELPELMRKYPALNKIFDLFVQRVRSSGDLDMMLGVATNILKSRFPEAEPAIMQSPTYACLYAKDVLKSRWPEAEPTIMQSPDVAYRYARHVIKGRWPEAEPVIMRSPSGACRYATNVLKSRWPEAEPLIIQDRVDAYEYARDVLKSRWPEAEPAIMQSSTYAYMYARDVLKSRWPEAEPTIMQDPEYAFWYANDVLKSRWPEAEPVIMKNGNSRKLYKKAFGL